MPDPTRDLMAALRTSFGLPAHDGLQPAEPISVTVRRYRCPHCTRSRASRQAIVEHIGRCWYAPENRTCKTCVHYELPDDACGCEPRCNWGGSPIPESCAAGVDLSGGAPVVHCERWEPKDG